MPSMMIAVSPKTLRNRSLFWVLKPLIWASISVWIFSGWVVGHGNPLVGAMLDAYFSSSATGWSKDVRSEITVRCVPDESPLTLPYPRLRRQVLELSSLLRHE